MDHTALSAPEWVSPAAQPAIDLTNCDREPIHIPGLIQPHGVLLVIQAVSLNIIQVSNNTSEILDRHPQDLLGKPLSVLFDGEQMQAIQRCLKGDFEGVNPLNLQVRSPQTSQDKTQDTTQDKTPDQIQDKTQDKPPDQVQDKTQDKAQDKTQDQTQDKTPDQTQDRTIWLNGILHTTGDIILLELEPKATPEQPDFFEFYQQVRGTITKLQKAVTLREMSQVVVNEIRRMTGFDRVMVYQFDTDGSGRVIAEATDLEHPFLHLRYPASDIPKQARHLYTLNWLRLIPNASYQPVGLTPPHHPLTGQPLDLSFAGLRSVSPIHLEYLQNMGVTASMSISLIQDQNLWGLIACHHSSPHYVPYHIRTACEFIGQIMSVELANKAANEDLDYKMALKSLQTRFVESLSQADDLFEGLVQLESNLLNLVSATGAVVCLGDRSVSIGQTPPESALPALITWLKPRLQHNLFETRSLSQDYPEAESLKAIASGLLALEISKVHQSYILWFRPEVPQTVNWGGNPNKPAELQPDGSQHLSPRKSFALWQETVSGYALPWKPCEIEIVTELRSLIVGIVLRQADELASMNQELQRSNEELDSFAYIASHDLKEPLRGIHNYANFLMEDHGTVLNEDGITKLQTLVRLTQRMEDLINSLLFFSRLGRAELVH